MQQEVMLQVYDKNQLTSYEEDYESETLTLLEAENTLELKTLTLLEPEITEPKTLTSLEPEIILEPKTLTPLESEKNTLESETPLELIANDNI
ncbi:10354_t:CDS:2 [Cetraspora pellucida]|uniref:10354_t:CDS:1 n=1 Tax=Cetraspora pellucida TaxID=1433469 RepID=A0ACA9KAI9_9GLOM|nr:10354_t:CDS:2 [Cetraspora pellucida]